LSFHLPNQWFTNNYFNLDCCFSLAVEKPLLRYRNLVAAPAVSDGVIAIIITIMVLELKVPHGHELSELRPLIPIFLSYVLSFVYLGIYWNNHHHLLQAAQTVNGQILWANLHLLFWLSLVPFTTAWMGENGFAEWPVALYGFNFLLCGIAYYFLVHSLTTHHGKASTITSAIGRDYKGKLSVMIYAVSIPLAFVHSWIACTGYVVTAALWFIPDRRIERVMRK
jgi:uncharacterized membrane protein